MFTSYLTNILAMIRITNHAKNKDFRIHQQYFLLIQYVFVVNQILFQKEKHQDVENRKK